MTVHQLRVLVAASLAAPGDWTDEAFGLAYEAAKRLIRIAGGE